MEPTLQALAGSIRQASESGTALRLRAGGTKDFLAEQLVGEVLDTRSHAGVVRHEPSELYVTARCGTPLAELEQLLAGHGQCLPFEPPHFGAHATVGGMVAAGLSGPSRASVGSVRDHVLGVSLVDGRGELLVFGGQVMKNVAGYDVSRALAGSMGTLGLIAEVTLKVLPVAPAQATLVFEMGQQRALDQLAAWGGQPLPLNASLWVRDTTTQPVRELLFVRLRGAQAAVQAACLGMGGDLLDATAAAPLWAQAREQELPFFTQPPSPTHALWRLSVAQTAPELSLAGPQLLDWHGAQRWLWAPVDAAAAIREAAARAGGHATLWRVPAQGAVPPGLRFTPPAAALRVIGQRLRAQFDPAGILSRQRMYLEH